jgi:hypothetical protein
MSIRTTAAVTLALAVMLTACGGGNDGGTDAEPAKPAEPATSEGLPEGSFVTSVTREDAEAAQVSGRDLKDYPADLTMTIAAGEIELQCGPPGGAQVSCGTFSYTSTPQSAVLIDSEAQTIVRLTWELNGESLSMDVAEQDGGSPDLQAYMARTSATFESHPWTRAG